MIGFYDYTVILTYIGLFSSITGMTFAIGGHSNLAVFCLAFSGLCDMFDGKIARTKKNRTDDQKLFGVQIDSLCDVVCFGVLPIVLCYTISPTTHPILKAIILGYYGICSVIRLGFYNVLETNRQRVETGGNTSFHGLPITTSSIFVPLIYMTRVFIKISTFSFVILALMVVLGTLFILDIKLPKPSSFILNILAFVAIILLGIFLFKNRNLEMINTLRHFKVY